MEITINIWTILGAILGFFIVALIGFKEFREKVAAFLLTIFVISAILFIVCSIPVCLYAAVAEQYSIREIHKFAPTEYHKYITFWEKISLKQVPLSELKDRHEKEVNKDEIEKKKYLGS